MRWKISVHPDRNFVRSRCATPDHGDSTPVWEHEEVWQASKTHNRNAKRRCSGRAHHTCITSSTDLRVYGSISARNDGLESGQMGAVIVNGLPLDTDSIRLSHVRPRSPKELELDRRKVQRRQKTNRDTTNSARPPDSVQRVLLDRRDRGAGSEATERRIGASAKNAQTGEDDEGDDTHARLTSAVY